MRELWFARSLFEPDQNAFQPRKITARHGDSAESFQECRKQRSSFRLRFFSQCLQRAAAQVFRKLIRPQRFNDRGELIEPCGDFAPRCHFLHLEAPRIIQKNISCFAARRVDARVGELGKRLPQRRNRHAPDFLSPQYSRFLARREFHPKTFVQLFAVFLGSPCRGQRGEMLRRVRPFISSGSNEYVRQLKDGRSHSLRRYLADIEFGADKLQHQNLGKTQEIRLWFFRVARAILRNRAQEHANGFPARFVQRSMNRTCRFLRR